MGYLCKKTFSARVISENDEAFKELDQIATRPKPGVLPSQDVPPLLLLREVVEPSPRREDRGNRKAQSQHFQRKPEVIRHPPVLRKHETHHPFKRHCGCD